MTQWCSTVANDVQTNPAAAGRHAGVWRSATQGLLPAWASSRSPAGHAAGVLTGDEFDLTIDRS
jgi:hypothetical protein